MNVPELIVVGTSLGGLNALTTVLGHLPRQFPVPIAIVQHRTNTPDGGGLVALLQAHSQLDVVEADDKMSMRAGTVYLAPSDYHLLIEAAGTLALSTDAPVRSARPSIDVLFETAADVRRGPSRGPAHRGQCRRRRPNSRGRRASRCGSSR